MWLLGFALDVVLSGHAHRIMESLGWKAVKSVQEVLAALLKLLIALAA